jgi:hypothetical protein
MLDQRAQRPLGDRGVDVDLERDLEARRDHIARIEPEPEQRRRGRHLQLRSLLAPELAAHAHELAGDELHRVGAALQRGAQPQRDGVRLDDGVAIDHRDPAAEAARRLGGGRRVREPDPEAPRPRRGRRGRQARQ